MQKQLTLFKSVIKDFESFFHFDSACTTEVAKLACLECLKWLGQIEDQVKANAQAQDDANKDNEPKQEEAKVA